MIEKSKKVLFFVSYVYIILIAFVVKAQNPLQQNTFQNNQRDQLTFANDSTRTWQPFKVKEIQYTVGSNQLKTYTIDTTLQNFQVYDPAQQADFNYRTIGSVGLAAYPIFFQPNIAFGFDLGYNAFNLYKLNTENLKRFNNYQPFTEFNFMIGRSREQIANITHAQNIKNRFLFGFEYNRVAGKGFFRNQEANNNNFAVNTLYKSKNQHYQIGGSFIFNNISAQENGGLENSTILFNDTTALGNELKAVNLSNATTEMRDREVILHQQWALGKKITKKINDTLSYTELATTLIFYHDIAYKRNRINYTDDITQSDSIYYKIFYPTPDTTLLKDSLGNNILLQNIRNKAGVVLQFPSASDSNSVSYKNFVLDLSVVHDYFTLLNNETTTPLQNLNFIGFLSSHPQSKKPIVYKAKAAFSFINYNSGDLLLEGLLGYDFKKWGFIEVSASQQRSEASWVYQNFNIRDFSWNNSFEKINLLSVSGNYHLKKYHASVGVKFYNITNLLYFNEERLPAQFNGNTQAWMFHAEKNFRYKGLGLDNLLRFQLFSGSDLIRMPQTFLRHSFFYERKLFKDALQSRIGLDMTYNTNYFGNGYFPLTNQFFVQNTNWLRFYPVFDVWVAFKIKTFRLFLKVDHVNQGLFQQKNYYNFKDYPGVQRSFRIGLSWRFYD